MENSDIAKIFWEMAELLELKEDNPFRIRSYQKAAQNIENLAENLAAIYKKGGLAALEEIPGIGESIGNKIEEILNTGKLAKYNQLRKQFPSGILEIMEIPGIGPKFAILVNKNQKIGSVDSLEKAAKAGKLQGLPGVQAKKIGNILKGIEQYRRHKGRFPLGIALPYAETIVAKLKELKEVQQIEIAGSLRRRKETIGDIDILVTANKTKKVMNTFVKLPDVVRVLAQGETKSSVNLRNGLQADVRVVPPESFGAALAYFTGSKAHNIRLREMGVKKGLKINEYGVFKVKGNQRLGGKEEKDVYAALHLPYIPPELREDRGEIAAAQKNKLPKLIECADLRGEFHAHTTASDGNNTLEEMAEEAQRLQLEYMAITEHSKSMGIAHGLSEKELFARLKKIEQFNAHSSHFQILTGTEVDIKSDGSLDYPDDILKRLDVVIASVHSNFGMEKEAMTQRISKALKNKYVNILGHPTGRLLGKRDPYALDLEKIMAVAQDTGTFIELNAYPERLDLDDIHCKQAKEMGIMIVIGTDAHTTSQLSMLQYGISVARRGWLEKKDVLNTYPLPKVLKLLQQKR